jgi:phosphoglycerol transferase
MQLWRADFRVPFTTGGDALVSEMVIKGVIERGFNWQNDSIGMPEGFDSRDLPVADNLQLLPIGFLSIFTSDPALLLNLFFVLTFPLTTLTSIYVLRRFDISYPVAALASLLYTFVPYHFLRGESHLFLAAYYTIPLVTLVALWICSGELWMRGEGENASEAPLESRWPKVKIIGSAIVCLLVAACGIYYPFFACYFFLIAGIAATLREKQIRHLITAGAFTALTCLGVLANLAPTILYTWANGMTPISFRGAGEAEALGLKIVQLLLPIYRHRVSAMAALVERYLVGRPLITENTIVSLGVMGSFGFLLLLVWLLCGRRSNGETASQHRQLMEHLSVLNIAAVLLGTIGGFGAIFALLVSPQIRSYNRVSIFIAFYALMAVALILEKASRTYASTGLRRVLFLLFLAGVLAVGILDQTGPLFVPNYSQQKSAYQNDAEFINRIEASVPPGAMIFQLPYMQFPEPLKVYALDAYAPLRGYLHSKTLRWSYGAMMTRESDLWQRYVAALPVKDLVENVAKAGFSGIYLDRSGYSDRGAVMEGKLSSLLGVQPLVSKNGNLLFYKLENYPLN